jgi:hypothetical protein
MWRFMHLDLSDEETPALIKELHDIVENDRYLLAAHPHAEGDPRQAQTGVGSRTPAAAEGVCAAIERPISETWLDDAQPSMTELVAAPPPPLGRAYHQKPSRMAADAATGLTMLALH